MAPSVPRYYPFFDPYRDGDTLSYPSKIGISLALGGLYMLFQYFVLPDKVTFFEYYCWVGGAVIATAMLALYIATDVFRRNIEIIRELEGDGRVSNYVVSTWLSDKWYITTGMIMGITTSVVFTVLGVPAVFFETPASLLGVYAGFFLAGFTGGMGLHAVICLLVLYIKFAPSLEHSLDVTTSSGDVGLKKLGDSLWFFAGLIASVGILESVYLINVPWVNSYLQYVRTLFVAWIAFPYLLAISVVLVPGLVVRRHVSYFKSHKTRQLKEEKAKLYSSFKKFEAKDDDEIISEKKEINERMQHIQEQMDRLRDMRNSHLDN